MELDLGTANVSRTIEAPHGNRQNALRGSCFTRELGSVHSHHWSLEMRTLSSRSSEADLFKRAIELLSFFESCIEEVSKGGWVDKQMVADVIEKADDVITETTNEDIIHLMLVTIDRLEKADLI